MEVAKKTYVFRALAKVSSNNHGEETKLVYLLTD